MQGYIERLAAAGEVLIFDCSWYHAPVSSASWATASATPRRVPAGAPALGGADHRVRHHVLHLIEEKHIAPAEVFVPCPLMGTLLSNTVPLIFPHLRWPTRTASFELISSYALSILLAMSLMSMQL
jgi:Sodium/glutamate symporter